MLIGNQYSDNKIYRGIRHYDSLPLASEDIHEYTDTVYMKTAYIMNNIIGYGALNAPAVTISNSGIRLTEPTVLLIDGDVSLIQSDDGAPLISKSEIAEAGYSIGSICIVGWYQAITANSTLRNYGGVKNSILPNDLLDEEFGVQLSSRYQFRWVPILLDSEDLSNDTITFALSDRDSTGELLAETHEITATKKFGDSFTAPAPMDYAVSDLYVVPIAKYLYDVDSDNIQSASAHVPVSPKGSSGFIKSETTPLGEYPEGTTWYNPITREFKTYVEGVGFVDSASTMGFLQYQSIYTIPTAIETTQDITLPIDINEFEEGDILQVVYEGLVLIANEHYTINYNNHTITLLGFTVNLGDKITFTVTKIVEANDITNITTTFTTHMASTGSSTREAHVKLSDSIDSTSDANGGTAATPRAVYESRLIADTTNNIKYRFGVENGLLYLEEV